MGGDNPKPGKKRRAASKDSQPDIKSWYLDSIETAPFGTLIHDKAGNILFFNKYLENFCGYSSDEIPDLRTWITLIYPEKNYRQMVSDDRSRMRPAKELRVRETIITTKDGQKRLCRFSSKTAASGIRTVIIQEIKGGQEAVAGAIEGYERFQSQFHTTPTPLIAWKFQKPDFVLTTCNKAAKKLTSGKIGDYLGKPIQDVFINPSPVVEAMRKCLKEKTRVECNEQCVLPGTDADVRFDCTFLYVPARGRGHASFKPNPASASQGKPPEKRAALPRSGEHAADHHIRDR